jgi:hypothetical protein
MTGYSPEFDWNPRNDTDHGIVVRHQPAIAVYTNPHDEVVIRQRDQYDESDDHFVYITEDSVLRVAQRMLDLAGIEFQRKEPLLLPPPSNGAERQRRYRQRHRNGNGHDVTPQSALVPIQDQQKLVG